MITFNIKQNQKESCCDAGTNNCLTPKPKSKEVCPKCKNKAKGVLVKTLKALLKDETKEKLKSLEGFYYCKTPSCKVIYFNDKTILTQDDVKVVVGLKDGAKPATICYCFGWSKEKIKNDLEKHAKTDALDDIKLKMKNPGCSCEVLNPSGGCCLGDVTNAIKEIKKELDLA